MADWICRTTGNYCAEIEHVERLEKRVAELEAERERWIETLKLCYRKLVKADNYSQDMGWSEWGSRYELVNRLCDDLVNLMGEDAYYAWRDDMQHSEP